MSSTPPRFNHVALTVPEISGEFRTVLEWADEIRRLGVRANADLPDQAEIPTITGRIVAISAQIENDEDLPLRQYDKILFHPKNAIPVDFEADNQLFVVPVEDVVAVFRKEGEG